MKRTTFKSSGRLDNPFKKAKHVKLDQFSGMSNRLNTWLTKSSIDCTTSVQNTVDSASDEKVEAAEENEPENLEESRRNVHRQEVEAEDIPGLHMLANQSHDITSLSVSTDKSLTVARKSTLFQSTALIRDFERSLVVLKQQAMTSFVIAGGAKATPQHPLCQRFYLSDPKQLNTYNQIQIAQNPKRFDYSMKHHHGKLCASKLRCSHVQFETVSNGKGERVGVRSIKFDKDGILFAAIGSNGIVRIFDFDECVGRMQSGSTRDVPCVLHLDVGTDAADVQWSPREEDTIAVALTCSAPVLVFDLQRPQRPTAALECGRTVSGGHAVLLYLPAEPASAQESHPQQQARNQGQGQSLAQCDRIVAGSTNGYIRMWRVDKASRPQWEMVVDPSAATSAVVALVSLPRAGHIAAMTHLGAVTIFDTSKLKVAAFKSGSAPEVVHRIAQWPALQLPPHSPFRPIDLVLGHAAPPLQQERGVGGHFYISTSVGKIFRLEVAPGQGRAAGVVAGATAATVYPSLETAIEGHAQATRREVKATTGPQAGAGEGQGDGGLGDEAATRFLSAPPCRAVFPSWGAQGQTRFALVGKHGSACLRVVDVGLAAACAAPISIHGQDHRLLTLDAAQTVETSPRVYRGGGSSGGSSGGNGMRKCAHVGLTLPGHIVSASPGALEVVTSHDLRKYLAAQAAADASRSRSSRVYFDWRSLEAPPLSLALSPPSGSMQEVERTPFVDSHGRGHVDGCENAVHHIGAHVLSLAEPYCGPEVEGGRPRVLLRTNLVPTGARVVGDGTIGGWEEAGLVSEIDMGSPPTALCAHPQLPHVVVGLMDGRVVVLGPDVPDADGDGDGVVDVEKAMDAT